LTVLAQGQLHLVSCIQIKNMWSHALTPTCITVTCCLIELIQN